MPEPPSTSAIAEGLRQAGLARDAIRLIQEARKNSGLDVADRIALRWTSTDPAVIAALSGMPSLIADEVLATDFAQGEAAARTASRSPTRACR